MNIIKCNRTNPITIQDLENNSVLIEVENTDIDTKYIEVINGVSYLDMSLSYESDSNLEYGYFAVGSKYNIYKNIDTLIKDVTDILTKGVYDYSKDVSVTTEHIIEPQLLETEDDWYGTIKENGKSYCEGSLSALSGVFDIYLCGNDDML